jgi:hypothetical protein
MFLKFEVLKSEIVERQGLTKQKYSTDGAIIPGGKPWHMRLQECHVFSVDEKGVIAKYPDKFELALENGRKADPDLGITAIPEQAPFAAGVYDLSPSAVFVDRENHLNIRCRLAPLAVGKTA